MSWTGPTQRAAQADRQRPPSSPNTLHLPWQCPLVGTAWESELEMGSQLL